MLRQRGRSIAQLVVAAFVLDAIAAEPGVRVDNGPPAERVRQRWRNVDALLLLPLILPGVLLVVRVRRLKLGNGGQHIDLHSGLR